MPPTVRRSDTHRAVSRDVWLCQNTDFLHDLYNLVRTANQQTGRRAFDRLTLAQWCELAFQHSTIYDRDDTSMYDDGDDHDILPNDEW